MCCSVLDLQLVPSKRQQTKQKRKLKKMDVKSRKHRQTKHRTMILHSNRITNNKQKVKKNRKYLAM